jgi:hypothetical protein
LERNSIHSCASSPYEGRDRLDCPPLYSSDISFVGDSYWGSIAYHRLLGRSLTLLRPLPDRSSPLLFPPPTSIIAPLVPAHPIKPVNNWLVGDVVYIPASQLFEPERLYAYPASVMMVLIAHITKRTLKQVTLYIPALGKDCVRGFAFMEVSHLSLLLTVNDVCLRELSPRKNGIGLFSPHNKTSTDTSEGSEEGVWNALGDGRKVSMSEGKGAQGR